MPHIIRIFVNYIRKSGKYITRTVHNEVGTAPNGAMRLKTPLSEVLKMDNR